MLVSALLAAGPVCHALSVPSRIKGLAVEESKETPGEMTITWNAVTTDVDNNPIDAADYWYVVTAYEDGSDEPRVLVDNLKETSYTYRAVESGQQFVYYRVSPASEERVYNEAYAESDNFCVGYPFMLPWLEDFEDAEAVNNNWLFSSSDANLLSLISGIEPENGTAYMGLKATWNATMPFHVELYSGKISLANTVSPKLSFKYYSIEKQYNSIMLLVVENGDPSLLGFMDTSESPTPGWAVKEFSLEDFAGKDIQIEFVVDAAMINSYVALDDITIRDIAAKDLAVENVNVLKPFSAGVVSDVVVTVDNKGLENIDGNYEIALSVNGNPIGVLTGESIEAGKSVDYKFEVRPDNSWGDLNELTAEVNYDEDEYLINNKLTIRQVRCSFNEFPLPDDVVGVVQDGKVVLEWGEPVGEASIYVEDSFESLDEYSITDFSPWTAVDVDGQPTLGISSTTGPVYFPNNYKPHAFIVFPNSFFGYEAVHGGNQMLVSFTTSDQHVDDWLISPELTGEEQEISFWTRVMFAGYNAVIEVAVSDTDNEIGSFETLESFDVISSSWSQKSLFLPEGTKYFALHVVENAYSVYLDDISYTRKMPEMQLIGYNIYKDGKKLNDAPVEGNSFTADYAEENELAVSALYDLGESKAAKATISQTGGVADAWAEPFSISVNGNTVRVEGATGKTMAAYTVDGKVLMEQQAGDCLEWRAPVNGIVILKVGTTAYKIKI